MELRKEHTTLDSKFALLERVTSEFSINIEAYKTHALAISVASKKLKIVPLTYFMSLLF